jgi:hydroxyacylglutathione hydrolase
MSVFAKQFRVGGDRNFGYLVADEATRRAVVVDPSYSPEIILDFSRDNGYQIVYIFATHGHIDHTNGNRTMESFTGLKVLLFGDTEASSGQILADGTRLPLGETAATILHTPGHTTDSMCVLVQDCLFTGDTLFVGKVGGTGFGADARAEYDSLHSKLMSLPDETRVFPGHDYGTAPESTIGNEKETNPFLCRPDFESFVDLKRNWTEYKRKLSDSSTSTCIPTGTRTRRDPMPRR